MTSFRIEVKPTRQEVTGNVLFVAWRMVDFHTKKSLVFLGHEIASTGHFTTLQPKARGGPALARL